MRLDLNVSLSAGAPVVGVAGEVDLLTADDLYEFLATVIRQRGPRLSVDLRRVTFMDSRGATALLRARRLARSLGGNLTLFGPSAPAALVLRAGTGSGDQLGMLPSRAPAGRDRDIPVPAVSSRRASEER
ncbi:STAS domain-containing protein [Nonomuraea candida]|uniref:STAS domain-containing protein n=1 Tax=Nonomuraea candida TaxID=359159 RepID=UPI0006948287|nr:STAS domain-containing protein [Nonomuraea candida]